MFPTPLSNRFGAERPFPCVTGQETACGAGEFVGTALIFEGGGFLLSNSGRFISNIRAGSQIESLGTLGGLPKGYNPNLFNLTGPQRIQPWMSGSKYSYGDDWITSYNAGNLKPKEGWADVVIHGNPDGKTFKLVDGSKYGTDISAQELANKLIAEGYKEGTPVRLVSCHSGRLCNGGASQLSEILKIKVQAPSVPVQVMPDGIFWLKPDFRLKNTVVKPRWFIFDNGVRNP